MPHGMVGKGLKEMIAPTETNETDYALQGQTNSVSLWRGSQLPAGLPLPSRAIRIQERGKAGG